MAIKFLNNVAVEYNVLFADTVNNRVGIGTTSPDETFTLRTSGNGLGGEGIFIKNPFAGSTPIVSSKSPFLSLGTSTNSAYNSTIYMGRNATATDQESKIEWSNANNGLSIYVKGTGTYREHVRFGNISSGTPKTYFGGNVGIGISSPSAPLHIYQLSTSGLKFSRASHDDIDLSLEGGDRFVISNTTDGLDIMSMLYDTGNVGIGTTSPATKLHIGTSSTSGTTTEEFRIQSGTSSGNGGTAIANLVTGAFGTSGIYFGNQSTYTSQDAYLKYADSNNTTTLQFSTRLNLESGSSSRMSIDSSGNVGIGTTSPAYKLDVAGRSRISTSSGTAPLLDLYNFDGDAFGRYYDETEGYAWSVGLDTSDSGKFKFAYDLDGSTLTTGTKMVIQTNGNVGIGTTSPNRTFTVASNDFAIAEFSRNTAGGGAAIVLQDGNDGEYELINGVSNFQIRSNFTDTQFYITRSTGNVGIGDTSPDAKLTVFRTDSTYAVNLSDTESRAGLSVKSSSSFDSKLTISSGASSRQYIQAVNNAATTGRDISINPYGGNVGIGTTSPGHLLEVRGTADALSVGDDSNTNTYARFANDRTYFGYLSSGNAFMQGGNSKGISFHTGSSTLGAGERMRIDSSGNVLINRTGTSGYGKLNVEGGADFTNGNVLLCRDAGLVGIGTASPTAKLGIHQAANNGNTGAFTNPHLKLSASATADGSGFCGITAATSTANNYGYSFGAQRTSGGVGDFKINYHNNSAAGTNRFLIDQDGNVGIGTTSPNAKLDVNGGVRIANDASTASATNVGTLRYRTSGNNSYVDMCMQTGASTYEWVNIVQNSW